MDSLHAIHAICVRTEQQRRHLLHNAHLARHLDLQFSVCAPARLVQAHANAQRWLRRSSAQTACAAGWRLL